MDWGFINIFKKAEFNTLMLSIAIAGWIMNIWIIPDNVYVVGITIMASIYCVIRFVVFCYNYTSHKQEQKAKEKKQNEIWKKKDEEKTKKWQNEIYRMFFGLSKENKSKLALLYLKGEKDPINYNILHFQKFGEDTIRANHAQEITSIFRGEMGTGMHCITLHEYTDTIAVTIDPFLYNLIKKYVEENQLLLNGN